MTHIEQAIRDAIKGGYQFCGYDLELQSVGNHDAEFILGNTYHSVLLDMIFLDPLFWQALGKAMGWDSVKYKPIEYKRVHPSGAVTTEFKTPIEKWHEAALACMDYLMSGKDAESFFAGL